jgi:hypothetical protein
MNRSFVISRSFFTSNWSSYCSRLLRNAAVHLPSAYGNRKRPSWTWTTTRFLLTEVQEPPPYATERPCVLILSEDDGLYPSSLDTALSHFPHDHGIPYARRYHESLEQESTSSNCNNDGTATDTDKYSVSIDQSLQELKLDLTTSLTTPLAHTILVARGPWISWQAQFYLEDLPLAALVLIDPVPLDDTMHVRTLEQFYRTLPPSSTESYRPRALRGFHNYCEHGAHWTLQLEAGSVPMLVVSTHLTLRPGAHATTQRHSHPRHGTVPVLELSLDAADHAEQVSQAVSKWILDSVL